MISDMRDSIIRKINIPAAKQIHIFQANGGINLGQLGC